MASRIEPLGRDAYLELCERLGSPPASPAAADLHISRAWAHSPGLMAAQTGLQRYFASGSPLPPRVREIAILRIGWRCAAPYEFFQHVRMGKDAGLRDDDIAAVATPAAEHAWTPAERLAIDVADELFTARDISTETWQRLGRHLETAQVVDLIALIGRYWTVSTFTRALRLRLEDGVTDLPDITFPAEEDQP